MALTVGSVLAGYDITALIGEGGMGQVFRAHGTRLNRDVALKILPDAFACDADRLARFTREARTRNCWRGRIRARSWRGRRPVTA